MFIANLFLFLVVIIIVIVLRGAINHHIALQELRRKNVNIIALQKTYAIDVLRSIFRIFSISRLYLL